MPDIEFVLSPEQKQKAAEILNYLMVSHYTTFEDWQCYLPIPDEPSVLRIVTALGTLRIELSDQMVLNLLRQILDSENERLSDLASFFEELS